jgi:hypothetical protein
MAFYCGKDLGDLIVVTLNKLVNHYDTSSARLIRVAFPQCRRGYSGNYSLEKLRVSAVYILSPSRILIATMPFRLKLLQSTIIGTFITYSVQANIYSPAHHRCYYTSSSFNSWYGIHHGRSAYHGAGFTPTSHTTEPHHAHHRVCSCLIIFMSDTYLPALGNTVS